MKQQLEKALKAFALLLLTIYLTPACTDNGDEPTPPDPSPSELGTPPANPYLAAEHYSVTHFNSAQTDAFPYAVKGGTFRIDTSSYHLNWSGPVNLMTLASTHKDYMWGMCSDRVSYICIADGKYERVAEAALPNINKHTESDLRKLVDTNYRQYPWADSTTGNGKRELCPLRQRQLRLYQCPHSHLPI